MYIRKVAQTNRETGKQYYTYRLAETYRNAEGKVRQRALLNLGAHFTLLPTKWKELADRVEEIIRGQQVLFVPEAAIETTAQGIAKQVIHKIALDKPPTEKVKKVTGEDYQQVDINSLEHQHVRQIGTEHVGYEIIKQLQLEQLLTELRFNGKQINTALGSIIGRLVAPGSERATHKYLQTQSALDELLGCNFKEITLDDLYGISDKLLRNKEIIEERLFQREKDLFQLEEIITLYDLTNTYFEGRALANSKAAFGRSKEKRHDCPLVTLALVLDASGFPKRSEVYEGNIGEPKTLAAILGQLEGKTKPTVVLDAGISSQENLDWLKEHGYYYIVVSKKNKQNLPAIYDFTLHHEQNFLVKAKLIRDEITGESELYCSSELKEKKEQAMHDQVAKRYEIELKKLASGLNKKRGTKKYQKVLNKLGRLQEKYKRISYTYKVEIIPDEIKQNTVAIKWDKLDGKQKCPGVYCLRSNRSDLDEQTFWDIYIMLTELEASFRCLKSELGLRPIFHQKTRRVDSHIFISILAYHLLHTIRHQLKQSQIHENWTSIRKDLSTHCRITNTMKRKDGKILHIRKSSLANPRQLEIYRALKIQTRPLKTETSVF